MLQEHLSHFFNTYVGTQGNIIFVSAFYTTKFKQFVLYYTHRYEIVQLKVTISSGGILHLKESFFFFSYKVESEMPVSLAIR